MVFRKVKNMTVLTNDKNNATSAVSLYYLTSPMKTF